MQVRKFKVRLIQVMARAVKLTMKNVEQFQHIAVAALFGKCHRDTGPAYDPARHPFCSIQHYENLRTSKAQEAARILTAVAAPSAA